jgi:YD repeat-containing protein
MSGKETDRVADKPAETKASPDNAQKQANDGMEDMSKDVKDYYKQRRAGLRDQETQKNLGDQPTFYDSKNKDGNGAKGNEKNTPAETKEDAIKAPEGKTDDQPASVTFPEKPAESTEKDAPKDAAPEPGETATQPEDGNRPETIKYPNGDSANVKYGPDGKPSDIEFSNGYKLSKNSDGKWTATDNGESKPTDIKDVEVSPDGSLIQTDNKGNQRTTLPDGSQSVEYKDGHSYQTDSQGRVTQEKRGSGDELKFKYDENGSLTEMEDHRGNKAQKDGDDWKHYGKDGQEKADSVEKNTTKSVDERGNLVTENKDDGTKVTERPDGSAQLQNRDRSKVEIDKDGKVTSTTGSDGNTVKYGYDDKGQLSEIEDKFGNKAVKDKESDTWKHYGPDGKEKTDEREENTKITVNNDGSVTRENTTDNTTTTKDINQTTSRTNADGSTESIKLDGTHTIKNSDGSSVEHSTDGSTAHKDAKGNITQIDQPDGKSKKFDYDEKGELVGYTNPEGDHYEQKPDGSWSTADGSGSRKDIEIMPDGTVRESKTDGGVETTRPDGSLHIDYQNGTKAEVDSKGNFTSYTSPDGRRFDSNANGNVTYTTQRSESLQDIAADALKVSHSLEPDYKPSPEEIKETVDELKKYNPGIQDTVPKGTKIVLD